MASTIALIITLKNLVSRVNIMSVVPPSAKLKKYACPPKKVLVVTSPLTNEILQIHGHSVIHCNKT